MYNIHLLPASFGDSILVEYGKKSEPKYILIDGGPYNQFEEVIHALQNRVPELTELELLVITHVDIDHIDGIVKLLNRDDLPFAIKDIWFNGWEEIKTILIEDGEDDLLGALQGEYLSHLITSKEFEHNALFEYKPVVVNDYASLPVISLGGGMELTLLGPGRKALIDLAPVWKKEVIEKIGEEAIDEKLESDKRYESDDDLMGAEDDNATIENLQKKLVLGDKSEANGSSIAFLASYGGKTCLLGGDATSDYLLEAIDPKLESEELDRFPLDAWKLSHHGSKKSTLDKLMEKIECKKMLISTDGKRYGHPDRATIAKLFKNNGPHLELYFNYKTEHNEEWDKENLKEKYKFKSFYPEDEHGITVSL